MSRLQSQLFDDEQPYVKGMEQEKLWYNIK